VLAGVDRTLLRLGEAGAMIGLVSGALEGAARTKLIPADLNRYFVFGAYGTDSADRGELTSIAIEKACRLQPEVTPAEVYVVGDTPLDIAAAEAAGAVSVGVASGAYSAGQLSAAGADHVMGSLEEPFPGELDRRRSGT
jgi:phosphoglycolate phosphatase-like HAD superfamily hydrolase